MSDRRMPDPVTRLSAALEDCYRIVCELGQRATGRVAFHD